MSKVIHLDAPNIGSSEKAYLGKAVDSGYVSTVGPFVPEFERKVKDFLKAKYAVATQSGTAALHMALYELGINEGDEVIVPALTFAATVNPVTYVRAKPVFVDIDPRTFTIDPKAIEANITRKTRAIIPVHIYGNPCNMKEILRIAKRYGLYVIEDATESLGARYNGQETGTFGNFGCLSFNGNKTITTGGGGMIVSGNKKNIEHIKFLINQAREERSGYYHPEIGFNYRMTNIEAALGLAQMEKLSGFLAKKQQFYRIYSDELKGIKAIRFQEEYDCAQSSRWFTCIVLDNKYSVSVVQEKLGAMGIPSRRLFMPLTSFPPYKPSRKKSLKNAHNLYERGLCLPCSTLNTLDDVVRVSRAIKKIINKQSFIRLGNSDVE